MDGKVGKARCVWRGNRLVDMNHMGIQAELEGKNLIRDSKDIGREGLWQKLWYVLWCEILLYIRKKEDKKMWAYVLLWLPCSWKHAVVLSSHPTHCRPSISLTGSCGLSNRRQYYQKR